MHRTFGQQLAFLRRRAHLTQETLAERAGLSRNYIGLLEGSRRQPSLETVLQIQKALRVELMELIPESYSSRSTQQERLLYGSPPTPTSQKYERLVYRLQKCTPEEIETILKIVNQALKPKRKK